MFVDAYVVKGRHTHVRLVYIPSSKWHPYLVSWVLIHAYTMLNTTGVSILCRVWYQCI